MSEVILTQAMERSEAGHRGEVCMESVPLYRLAKVVHNEQVPKVALVVRNQLASAEDPRDTRSIDASGRSPGGWRGNHSSILAWRIPWTEEAAGLQSIRSQSTGHD